MKKEEEEEEEEKGRRNIDGDREEKMRFFRSRGTEKGECHERET